MAEAGGTQPSHKFFRDRRNLGVGALDFDESAAIGGLIECVNVTPRVSMVIMAGKATLHELQTVYSLRDMHNLIEIIVVERHNDRAVRRWEEQEASRS